MMQKTPEDESEHLPPDDVAHEEEGNDPEPPEPEVSPKSE